MLIRAGGLHSLLVSYHKARLASASEAMQQFGTETTMPVWCSHRFQRHQRALQRLGFLVEREFTLLRRPLSGPDRYRAFCQLLRDRFTDNYWSCAGSGTRVVVTAPPSRMPEWQHFLSEYDDAA